MVQMFPWGWEQQQPAGWIDRECMFSHQAEAVSAWYFNWVNRDRLKGLQPMCAAWLEAMPCSERQHLSIDKETLACGSLDHHH